MGIFSYKKVLRTAHAVSSGSITSSISELYCNSLRGLEATGAAPAMREQREKTSKYHARGPEWLRRFCTINLRWALRRWHEVYVLRSTPDSSI